MMDAATFDRLSLQGHPFRFALDSDDVVDTLAEYISRIDFDAHHADREKAYKDRQWAHALERMECFRQRKGQVRAEAAPRTVVRKGDPEEVSVSYLEDYIEDVLGHIIDQGMRVFKFWHNDQPMFAATLIDTLHRDGEVFDWHVELYWSRKTANAEIARREHEISKRMVN